MNNTVEKNPINELECNDATGLNYSELFEYILYCIVTSFTKKRYILLPCYRLPLFMIADVCYKIYYSYL